MTEPRLIKKYANRRLYDTHTSRHITLDGIRQLIVEGVDIRIIDDTSGADITRTLLLQVIAEQEQGGVPLLDPKLLTRLIRLYGNPMQSFVSDYLLKSMEAFAKQQKVLQEQMRTAMNVTPLEAMQEFTSRNMEAWREFQNTLLGRKPAQTDKEPESDK